MIPEKKQIQPVSRVCPLVVSVVSWEKTSLSLSNAQLQLSHGDSFMLEFKAPSPEWTKPFNVIFLILKVVVNISRITVQDTDLLLEN